MSRNDETTQQAALLVERRGSFGFLTLNRLQRLNSMDLPMVQSFAAALANFSQDPTISAVLVRGINDRALCAGGDVRALYDARFDEKLYDGENLCRAFWRAEYQLNAMIDHFPKPYIALMNGIVMGGGVGISAYGSHRLVSDKTRLAMPEAAIGFFPDIGASWLLTRKPNNFGIFMALTGHEIGAADAIAMDLADFYIPDAALAELPDQLAAITAPSIATMRSEIDRLVKASARPPSSSALAPHYELIEHCFSFTTIEDMIGALKSNKDLFAQEMVQILNARSPTALKLTLELMRFGARARNVEECLSREFCAVCRIAQQHDFYEGVRALLIDKDHRPQWQPDSLVKVTQADIDAYFVPIKPALFDKVFH